MSENSHLLLCGMPLALCEEFRIHADGTAVL